MPYIKSRIQSENVVFEGVETTILDVEKTRELSLNEQKQKELSVNSLSYKDIEDLRDKYVSNEMFLKILESADERWQAIKKNVESIEIFYEIIWSRTHLELMFLAKYYTQELINPLSFELLVKNGAKFEYWWENNVKYNFLVKLKKFYMDAAEVYANVSPINIYEKDVVFKAKEAIENIEDAYLLDVKKYLEFEWKKAKEYYDEVFSKIQEEKRKSILFE